jgi:hypothetical protein
MNFQTAKWGLNGENLGIMLAFFCLTMNLIVLVFSFYLMTRPFKQLRKKSAKKIYGEMYENTKYNTRITLAYTFVFILRRFVFISIGMLNNDKKRGGV